MDTCRYVLFYCLYLVTFKRRRRTKCILDMLGIETVAYGEDLPGVVITCGSPENKGRCWDGECQTTWTPFGWYKAWDCSRATGNQNDFCSDGVPC